MGKPPRAAPRRRPLPANAAHEPFAQLPAKRLIRSSGGRGAVGHADTWSNTFQQLYAACKDIIAVVPYRVTY
jgi:hypothetical protein